MSDSLTAAYEARRLSVQMSLRKYYNHCVQVMAEEEAGAITTDQALERFLEFDAIYAKLIVDDIAPKKSIIEI